ncbi:MAG TPA: hypothetical protein VK897_11315 [Anaerolineales bacterium]|nr:hypothetical protein [Anaerolineales bacterium]
MKALRKFIHTPLVEVLLIVVIAGVTYLPHLSQATIYRDDWYYTMDRLIGGPGVFEEMFSIDRPARGSLFETYYQLFGIRPFPYHMSSFLWRVAGGLAALWLFRQLWPRQRLATFVMALLFALYPGYLRWMEGFENQPRILSSFLETLSIALTLQAIRTTRKLPKIFAWTCSVLTGWAYILLVDFAFGMEIFRLLCVFLLVNRNQESLSIVKKSILAARAWAITALIPFGFLFWRLFLFHNERPATDIGLQLSYLIASPLNTGAGWLLRLFQSAFNVLAPAWVEPLVQNLFEISLPDTTFGLLIAGIAVFLFLGISLLMEKIEGNNTNELDGISSQKWQSEAIWVGLTGVIVGVLPVIVANRYISMEVYSHYALPASLACVMTVVGVVSLLSSRNVRLGVASGLVLFAVLTHYTASLRVLHEERVIANFWHQVVWRAPGIKAGTTLFVSYPSVHYGEDVDAVAGPANFLYFPEQTNYIPVLYPLIALPQMEYTTINVLRGGKERADGYRTHVGEINYDNVLVISQPTEDSCVHVIDAQRPTYSSQDSDQILLLGQYSKIQNVLTDSRAPHPAEFIFGPEPAHTWCYYYQQAELALQEGDWEEVIEIGDRVAQSGLRPNDRIEWMPFLQAYAIKGDEKAFETTAEKIERLLFVRREACNVLLHIREMGSTFTPRIQSLINEKVCRDQTVLSP